MLSGGRCGNGKLILLLDSLNISKASCKSLSLRKSIGWWSSSKYFNIVILVLSDRAVVISAVSASIEFSWSDSRSRKVDLLFKVIFRASIIL
jgi:hypothetical protein